MCVWRCVTICVILWSFNGEDNREGPETFSGVLPTLTSLILYPTQCELNPRIPYTEFSTIIKKQKQVSFCKVFMLQDALSIVGPSCQYSVGSV